MKRIIISIFIVLLMTGASFLFSRQWSATDIQCQSTFEKVFTPESHVKGLISLHFFRDRSGVANIAGKMTADGTVFTVNREVGFTREAVDLQKGIFKVKKDYFKLLSGDNLPSHYSRDIDMNTDSQNSDYIIIRKVNKNTWLLSSPAMPVLMCVSE